MNPSTSPEQFEANRANARHSTGPRTEDGKARSSQNARVHGLCSRQLHIADEEEAAIFASLRAALSAQLAPAGELELLHFETIVLARWNLRRCRMNEANLLASPVPDPLLDPGIRAALNALSTYTSRHERAFHRAQKELKALQTERAIRTNFGSVDGSSEDDNENAEPSPLIETSRVRRTLLSGIAAKVAFNKKNDEAEPISYLPFHIAAKTTRVTEPRA